MFPKNFFLFSFILSLDEATQKSIEMGHLEPGQPLPYGNISSLLNVQKYEQTIEGEPCVVTGSTASFPSDLVPKTDENRIQVDFSFFCKGNLYSGFFFQSYKEYLDVFKNEPWVATV